MFILPFVVALSAATAQPLFPATDSGEKWVTFTHDSIRTPDGTRATYRARLSHARFCELSDLPEGPRCDTLWNALPTAAVLASDEVEAQLPNGEWVRHKKPSYCAIVAASLMLIAGQTCEDIWAALLDDIQANRKETSAQK